MTLAFQSTMGPGPILCSPLPWGEIRPQGRMNRETLLTPTLYPSGRGSPAVRLAPVDPIQKSPSRIARA